MLWLLWCLLVLWLLLLELEDGGVNNKGCWLLCSHPRELSYWYVQ